MTRKRQHHERIMKQEALRQHAKLDALAQGVAVNPTALAPHNSYSLPEFVERGYYVDKPFVCRSCGIAQIWTAAQQKWWYEVAKGDVFSTAAQCRACRQRERARKRQARLGGGDPNPYKNPGLLLARIRSEIEPELLSAGYIPAGRSARSARRLLFIHYTRPDGLFSLTWDQHQARLSAELLAAGSTELLPLATAEFSGARSTPEIEARLAPFLASLERFLKCPSEPGLESNLEGESSAPGASDSEA